MKTFFLTLILTLSLPTFAADVRTELLPWIKTNGEIGETTLGNTCTVQLMNETLIMTRGQNETMVFNNDSLFRITDVQRGTDFLVLRLYKDRQSSKAAVTHRLKINREGTRKRVKMIETIHNILNTTNTLTCLIHED